MAPSQALRGGIRGATVLGLTVLIGACTSAGETKDEPALVTTSEGTPSQRRCEVYTHSADIGTTTTTRCLEDLDGDGVADVIEVTKNRDWGRDTCVRSEREADRWRREPCIPEP